jgi:HPr kinase/phosphorylase
MSSAVHGTAVEIGGWAVLLTGKSGSGKSDLALRLLDRGATLVGDDYVDLRETTNMPCIRPAEKLAGKLEIAGLGIFERSYRPESPLRLIIELGEEGERHPVSWPLRDLQGWSVPLLRMDGFATSAPIKVELALKSIIDERMFPVRLSPAHD